MKLPPPRTAGSVSLEQALLGRRTVRKYGPKPLGPDDLSQLLWAAQGITESRGRKRAAPSAGALYPMDVYAVVGRDGVEGLAGGIYRYEPPGHQLALVRENDLRIAVARAALSQMWMAEAPISLVITAEVGRVGVKYGKRGGRYATIEAGHIAQNVLLQAEALGLKAGIIGAFNDADLIQALGVPRSHEPLLILPVGAAAER